MGRVLVFSVLNCGRLLHLPLLDDDPNEPPAPHSPDCIGPYLALRVSKIAFFRPQHRLKPALCDGSIWSDLDCEISHNRQRISGANSYRLLTEPVQALPAGGALPRSGPSAVPSHSNWSTEMTGKAKGPD